MSTAVSFISGKGGSGKTTLVLSIADLLSRCGINTLIIDCDFSTNGATFFYEALLKEKLKSKNTDDLYSLTDIIIRAVPKPYSLEEKIKPIIVKRHLEFIPSISEVVVSDDVSYMTSPFSEESFPKSRLIRFISWAKDNYDAILFDCQAGFTDTLNIILPYMDVDLFVLEPDSISASSMRNLHLKIGKKIGSAKVYQVFNKASQEEFDIYSKIVGTFYTNIGTLLFDWKIRQAFSRSQVPDLESVSKKFGSDLCDVCKIMFTDQEMNKKINDYSVHLHLLHEIEERDRIEKSLLELSANKGGNSNLTNFTAGAGIVTAIIAIMTFLLRDDFINSSSSLLIRILPIYCALAVTLLFYISRSSGDFRNKRRSYEKELKEMDKSINKLKKMDPFLEDSDLTAYTDAEQKWIDGRKASEGIDTNEE